MRTAEGQSLELTFRPGPEAVPAAGTPYRPPAEPLPVEVLQGTVRHGLITVLRLRPEG